MEQFHNRLIHNRPYS